MVDFNCINYEGHISLIIYKFVELLVLNVCADSNLTYTFI